MSDHWDFYFTHVNDKPASIFLDIDVNDDAPDPRRPWLLWVFVYFNQPRDDGFSSGEEAPALAKIEDALSEALSLNIGADQVGRITTDGRREFYFYGPKNDGLEGVTNEAMQAFPEYRWECGSDRDPEWNHYNDVLYPTPYDWQRMKNRQVVQQLEDHGDALDAKRVVTHWAGFDDKAGRKAFIEEIIRRGFTVADESDDDDPENPFPYSVSFEREDFVDWDSINEVTIELLDLAEEADGDYDGWETMIVRTS